MNGHLTPPHTHIFNLNLFDNINHRPTQTRVDTVSLASISTSFVIFLIVGCAGYSTFGDHVEPDILRMYPLNTFTSLCRFMTSIIVICHFPVPFLFSFVLFIFIDSSNVSMLTEVC